jgi:hypothetical protein
MCCFHAHISFSVATKYRSAGNIGQAGEGTALFLRNVDQSDPVVQAAMLQGLNATIHTRHVNATLSSFSDNWCRIEYQICQTLSSHDTMPAVLASGFQVAAPLQRRHDA